MFEPIELDLWVVISVFREEMFVWTRMADEPNSAAHAVLIPSLDEMGEEEAVQARDIVNTMFPSTDAIRFVDALSVDPEYREGEHRILTIDDPWVRWVHRVSWFRTHFEYYPFGYGDSPRKWEISGRAAVVRSTFIPGSPRELVAPRR